MIKKLFPIVLTLFIQLSAEANIITHPADQSVCSNSNTSFTFTHSFSSPTFQWQRWDGTIFINISNNGTYSGVTTDNLTITGASSNETFRCKIMDNSVPDSTDPADLTILTATSISGHPSNTTVCENANASFSTTANGANLGYQWQLNSGSGWTDISVAGSSPVYSNFTTNTLSLNGIPVTASGYKYRCVVTGTCGVETSNEATISVNALPKINNQAANTSVCAGQNAGFSISASGTGISYQWQVNIAGTWSDIVAAGSGPTYSNYTSPTLSLSAVQASNNGYLYRCVVTGTCSPIAVSNSVQLTVLTAPSIVSNPGNQIVCPGQQAVFSISAQGSNLTYKWQVSITSGSWSDISNGGSGPTYSNATTNNLTVSAINTQHTGYKYRCIASGTCTPSSQSNEASLTVHVPPYLTTMPQNATLCEDGNTQYSVQASGTGLNYQWQIKNGSSWTNISTAGTSPQFAGWTSSNLTLSNVPLSYNGDSLRCVVSGTCSPNSTSYSAALIVYQKPVIQSQPGNQLGCEGGTVTFSVSAVGTALNYQWQVNSGTGWTNINGGNAPNYSGWNTASLHLSSLLSWNSGYYYRCLVSGYCQPSQISDSAMLEVHAMPYLNSTLTDQSVCEGEDVSWNITSSGNNLNYTWQIDTGTGWMTLATYGLSADFQGLSTYQLVLPAATRLYDDAFILVSVGNQGCGLKYSNTARLTVFAKPDFSIGPDRYICAGQATQLNLTNPNGALNRFDWSPSIGLSNPFIQAPIATPAAITTYILTAWDTNGCYQMDTFQLDVKANPVANAGADQELCAASNFTLSGSGGLSYAWFGSSGVQVGTGNTVFVEAKSSESYTLKISDQYSCTDSDYVFVKVNPLPNTNAGQDLSVCRGKEVQFSASGAATYQWLVNGLSDSLIYNPKLTAVNSGSIILNGWSDKGCLNMDTLYLTVFSLPQLLTSIDTQICEGSEALLRASGASSYKWYPIADLVNSTTTSPSYKGIKSQLLFVEGKDLNGCLAIDSVFVKVNPLPNVDAGLNERICSGSSIQLKATGASAYIWTPGNLLDDSLVATPEATPLVSGDFVVKGTDDNGCIAYDTVYVEVMPNPTPAIMGESEVCKGQQWTVYKSDYAGGDLVWEVQGGLIQSGYGTEQVHIAWDTTLLSGEVRITETSSDGCKGTSILAVNANAKNAAKPVEVIAKANDIRTGILISRNTDLDNYFWGKETKDGSRAETLDSGDYWTTYNYIDTFNYRYWLLAGNQGECLTKNYFGGYPLVSVRNIDQQTVDLYPNPNRGQFQVVLNFEPNELILRNGLGVSVVCHFEEMEPGVWMADVEALRPGIYYMEVRDGEGVRWVERVVVTE